MNNIPPRDVAVFTEAIRLPAIERAGYLARACADDPELRRKVDALLAAYDGVGDFLEEPGSGAWARTEALGQKPGDRIGRYRLLQQIGEGGCGVVYMAEQEEPVRRRVALKIIKPGMDTRSVIARFEAERQALALMDHPGIAKIFDAGTTETGRPYFVMELVRGVKITSYCDDHALTTDERLDLFVEVCQAVQHAHQKGIIHRDLKPSNILVTQTVEGRALPVVIDFGIAKATTNQRLTDKTLFTAFEMLIGTPAYMSPEQAVLGSVDVDTRTDIYSLGVLLYELLTGTTPFDAGELLKAGLDEVRRVIREQDPARPSARVSQMTREQQTTVAHQRKSEPPRLIRSMSGDLDWIAMKALEKDRTRRYETANGLASDVKRFMADETVTARPPSASYRFRKTVARHRLFFASASIIALLLVVSLTVIAASLAKERRARLEADADRIKAQAESSKSQQVTRFLEQMLRGVGPSVALGRDTTMLREILDEAAVRVGRELADQPATRVQLQQTIGGVYQQLALFDKAEAIYRDALAGVRASPEQDQSSLGTTLNELGRMLIRNRKLAEAEQVLREALQTRQRVLGPEHPDVATTINNLAAVSFYQGRLDESEGLSRQALAMRKKLLGNQHLAVAESLNSLAILLSAKGEIAGAKQASEEVLTIRRAQLGPEHPLVATALYSVGYYRWMLGNLPEAEQTLREVLAMRRKLLGDHHREVVTTLHLLGDILRREGKFDEAKAYLSESLATARGQGPNTPEIYEVLNSLSDLYRDEGRFPEAEEAAREIVTTTRQRYGKEHHDFAEGVSTLIGVLSVQKKYTEAESILADILSPDFIRTPPSAPILKTRVLLYARQQRWPEAVGDAERILGFEPSNYLVYNWLAPLWVHTGRVDEYRSIRTKIVATFSATKDSHIADRMAKACLLLPASSGEIKAIEAMTQTALLVDRTHVNFAVSQCGAALAAYRRGDFAGAVTAARAALAGQPPIEVRIEGEPVLAMALFQLKQLEEARILSRDFLELFRTPMPELTGEFERVSGQNWGWEAWVSGQVLLKEAAGLVRDSHAAQPDADRKGGTP